MRRAIFGVAGFSGVLAGILTWVLGFLLPQAVSVVSTTLALLLILGGYWLLDPGKRRWSWILVLLGGVLGFGINIISPHFPVPGALVALSLLAALVGSFIPPTRPQPTQGEGDSDPGK